MALELFHFLRPYWLLLLPVLMVLLWLMLVRRLGSRSWEAVCDKHLIPFMLIGGSNRSRRLPVFLVGTCGLVTIVSLAGPVWEKLPQPVFNNQTALVIALDLSRSMDANDISPSRLSRARFKVADILNQHNEGHAALLVYAGDAFTVTPLTDDMATIVSQLPALTTGIMPGQGNRTDLALEKAEELLKGAGHSRGDILLISDEIDFSSIESQARHLGQNNYRISILGIGTEHGAPVVLEDGSFLKNSHGEIVIPVLDEKSMRKLVQAAGGYYRKMTPDDNDIRFLLNRISQNVSAQQQAVTEFETDIWREQGPWLLLLLVPLAALAFRRGYLIVLAIVIIPVPENVQALDWNSLWLRADQRAKREFDNGDPQTAAELFEDRAWRGAAQYKSGDYQASLESLETAGGIDALYNLGNAMARLGQYEDAIASYDKVLQQAPEHEDAKFNRKLLEDELKNQQQQDQQKSQQDQNEGKDQQQQQEQEGASEDQNEQQQSGQDNKQQQKDQQAGNNDNEQEMTPQEQQQKPSSDNEDRQEQEQQAQPEQKKPDSDADEQSQLTQARREDTDEEQQATEQWLRRIPDDPAGLLRRKFRYQYQQRKNRKRTEEKTW